ncbi:MAG: hypothetical protein A3E07_03315 [Candidatus Wildermuthbacteria bacterium RIFCSPHIGHO2_12_FULL_45_9]|nr:MAG: hypothetical protein A3E07_03315 [Candidatus Wildermuthbacteria bacterium RIFCSPHIGHO2_12_FULL_45_9]
MKSFILLSRVAKLGRLFGSKFWILLPLDVQIRAEATQAQIAEVFASEHSVVTKHIRNILKDR